MRFNITRRVIYDQFSSFLKSDSIHKVTWKRETIHIIITTLIVWSALGIACAIDDLAQVIGLTSAICASFIIYIFPAVCYYKLKKKKGKPCYLPWLVFLLGCFVLVGGVV
eukprot:Pgem_evm1s11104